MAWPRNELKGKVKINNQIVDTKEDQGKEKDNKWIGECRDMTSLVLNTRSPKQE